MSPSNEPLSQEQVRAKMAMVRGVEETPRGRSLDDLLEEAFRAGLKRGVYISGREAHAPDFAEWRRRLTERPQPLRRLCE